MENIDLEIQGDTLVIRIDLTRELGLTRSERSICVASSHGNVPLWLNGRPHPKNLKLNIACFRPLNREEKEERRRSLWG